MKGCRGGAAGGNLPQVGGALGVHHNASLEPGRDTCYMVQPLEGILEVGKGSQFKLRIGLFGRSGTSCNVFDSNATSLRNHLLMLRGSVFSCRRYVKSCMKVIFGLEYLVYVSPCCVDITRPVWNGPWNIHGGLCNTGDTFCSLMSPGFA
jgi:hypothetical protein